MEQSFLEQTVTLDASNVTLTLNVTILAFHNASSCEIHKHSSKEFSVQKIQDRKLLTIDLNPHFDLNLKLSNPNFTQYSKSCSTTIPNTVANEPENDVNRKIQ